uniref:Uncharacterized protein n=1 Tax=Anguilla anguilla TaxID=7936 RepID=A0A0E9V7D8_ANGAN
MNTTIYSKHSFPVLTLCFPCFNINIFRALRSASAGIVCQLPGSVSTRGG